MLLLRAKLSPVGVTRQVHSRKAMLETLVKHLDMVRLSVLAAVIVATACTGVVNDIHTSGSDGTPLTPEQQMAEAAWEQSAYPAMTVCTGCHGGSMANVAFLQGSNALDARTTILGYNPQVVNLDAADSSRILTKGLHDGPALGADAATAILQWITLEKAAAAVGDTTPTLETTQFDVLPCTGGLPDNGSGTCPTNHVPLDALGLPGAEIDFVSQSLSDGLYLNELQVVAATDGAYIEHPLFVSHPAAGGDPVPDDLDRFFDVKLNLAPTTVSMIDGGTAVFVGFVPTDKVSITFKAVGPFMADSGSGAGSGSDAATGCQAVDSFTTNAQTPLMTNCATACHGGGDPNAKAAMDLSGLLGTPTPDTILTACDQVRTRINFQTIEQSGFFVAPNPADNTNHPFKFNGVQANFQTFHDSVVIWVNAEKIAP
jgi:hypothetical protein|nr:hypothetical protein [Kofleriaceae bacterium]